MPRAPLNQNQLIQIDNMEGKGFYGARFKGGLCYEVVSQLVVHKFDQIEDLVEATIEVERNNHAKKTFGWDKSYKPLEKKPFDKTIQRYPRLEGTNSFTPNIRVIVCFKCQGWGQKASESPNQRNIVLVEGDPYFVVDKVTKNNVSERTSQEDDGDDGEPEKVVKEGKVNVPYGLMSRTPHDDAWPEEGVERLRILLLLCLYCYCVVNPKGVTKRGHRFFKSWTVLTKLKKPSLPTPPHLQRYKLSFFDQLSEREHVPFVLFYPNNNFDNSTTIDERLEQSLSKVLTHVYPAAGRYDKDECSILCHDQGVSYTKADVNCKLNYFLEKTWEDLSLAALFWPHENKNVDENNLMVSPIVIAQVTKFECGGLALSLSGSHPAMDGFTDFNFLFEWAKVCKLGTPVEKINFLSFDLGFLSFQLSRVEIIAALLWMAFIRTSAAINGYLRPCLMDFPLNLRSKTSLPKVHKSMGNFRIDDPIKFIPEKTNMELHHSVILIRDTVSRVVASCAKASPDEIVSTLVNIYNESVRAPEWGALLFFGMMDTQMFWLHDMDCDSEVGEQVDLKESYMQLFERDDGIKALTFIRDANL
ncbi:putative S-type anion channel SLAH1-like [Capsicum annuum]|nr:putative S-type anion channel SLAH1-like [Capsicum annuum]KAF3684440.1 putative S-type anion channel SLAH1-like [Capsicum annuum]